MTSVIVAVLNRENGELIAGKIRKAGIGVDGICSYGAETLNTAYSFDRGIVICTGRLKDMNYLELMGYLPDTYHMLLLTKNPEEDYCNSDRFLKLAMPFKSTDLINTIRMLLSSSEREEGKRKKVIKKRTEEEEKILLGAKSILMERNNMTEPEAFRYMQKCSMDTSRSMLETAKMILTLYV